MPTLRHIHPTKQMAQYPKKPNTQTINMKLFLTSVVVLNSLAVLTAGASEETKKRSKSEDKANDSATPVVSESNSLLEGWTTSFLQPSLRYYYDYGSDDPGEVDLYNDGNLVPTIDLVEIYRPYSLKNFFLGGRDLIVGPSFGLGLSGPAKDGTGDNAQTTGNAPVVVFTAGAIIGIPVGKNGALVGIEGGHAWGASFDEGFADSDDYAVYVGISYKFRF